MTERRPEDSDGETDGTDSQDASLSERARNSLPLSRRGTIVALASFGGLSALSDPGAANHGGGHGGNGGGNKGGGGGTRPWRGDVNANGNSLLNLSTSQSP
ncbi:MAG: hypothetical protein ABEI39_06415 [Halobacteriales archaeon]